MPDFRVADSDPAFLPGIQIRFSNFSGSGSGSGIQISLDPDPVSVPGFRIPDLDPRGKNLQKLLQQKTYDSGSSKNIKTGSGCILIRNYKLFFI